MRSTGARSPAAEWARLEGRNNALNTLRLGLATVVIVAHAWDITRGPRDAGATPAAIAVDAFFVISGFLIAGSRSRLDGPRFAVHRVLRLVPGYWLALVVTAAVFAPFASAYQGLVHDWSASLDYLRYNWPLLMTQSGIGNTLATAPIPNLWNASLWTLFHEGAAYLLFGIVLSVKRLAPPAALASYLLLTLYVVQKWGFGEGPDVPAQMGRLFLFFCAGVLMWFAKSWFPLDARLATGSVVIVAGCVFLPYVAYLTIAPLPLAVVLLWLGARLPTRVGSRNDISYGMYVFAFPIQQLLVLTGVAAWLGDAPFAVVSILATVPLAWASWLLVEQPALRLRPRPHPKPLTEASAVPEPAEIPALSAPDPIVPGGPLDLGVPG